VSNGAVFFWCIAQHWFVHSFLRGDTAGKNIVFFLLVSFVIFGLFVFNNMSSFRLVVKKSPKYTFRSLFYYTLSICTCRFLLNSTKVGVIAPRLLSAPCHVI